MTRSARLGLALVLAALGLPALASAQVASKPDTHTVRPGDTLWDLARTYLGDPFLWPEIYRLNTAVVEDPHWIYPGEVLRLAGGAEVSAVPATDTPAPAGQPVEAAQPLAQAPAAEPQPEAPAPVADEPAALNEPEVADAAAEAGPTDSVDLTPLVGNRNTRRAAGPSLEASLARNYRPLRRSEFYSSGFLTEEQVLPFGKVLGLVTPPAIEEVTNRSTAMIYAKVAVTPPAGAQYQVGDTLLVGIVQREIRGYGRVFLPTGLVRIIDVSRAENLAEVVAAYGPVRDQQVTLPIEKFADPGNVRAVPISDGVVGRVIAGRDEQPLIGPQDVIFLDRGRTDGVALGDQFELRRSARERVNRADLVNEVMATVQVVHVGEHTSTARVLRVTQPDVPVGIEARQVAKLPS